MKAQKNRGQNVGGGGGGMTYLSGKERILTRDCMTTAADATSSHVMHTLQYSICAFTSSELTRIQPLDVAKDVTNSSTKALPKGKKE